MAQTAAQETVAEAMAMVAAPRAVAQMVMVGGRRAEALGVRAEVAWVGL